MKISVVTVCYNSAATIEHALKSVTGQDYQELEYIIVDGKSKDNTLQVIDRYRDRIATVISEKDKGIYDAINKGIQAATGDVVGLLHSDDFLAHPEVLTNIASTFAKNPEAKAIYSDLQYVDKDDPEKVIRNWISGDYQKGDFLKGWMPPHPTFYARKELFDQLGYYNLSFSISADYELMLRFIHKNAVPVAYLPQVLVKMRVGGKSNVSLTNRLQANREDSQAWKVNGLRPGILTRFLKPLSKLKQFRKKKAS